MQDTRLVLDMYRRFETAYRERRQTVIDAIHSELQAHGRPLHYAVLARMVADRYPRLQVSESGVLMTMVHNSDMFERVAVGVYRSR